MLMSRRQNGTKLNAKFKMQNAKFLPIIGLEVHIELKTRSKMFCSCSTHSFGHQPNSHVCPICLGLPGTLPVPNKKAIEWCLMTGLAFNCQIPEVSKFDRKNYFYPDLPKGYQISQYDQPFCINGWLKIGKRKIRIRRVHMEEDTAKMIHRTVDGRKATLLDFNRSGVPLMEIVTDPDLSSPIEARAYLKKLQQIIRYLDVSDCDMEKGSMRCEANISLSRAGSKKLPDYKIEIKNLNSFRFVEKALEYEIKRQKKLLEGGKKLTQETRGWDEIKQITFLQRVKETAADYRYFPEPDIPPIKWKKAEIEKLRRLLPELPDEKVKRLMKSYGLSESQASILAATRERADYFEEAVKVGKKHGLKAMKIANVIINKRVNLKKYLPAALVKLLIKKKTDLITDEKQLSGLVKQVIVANPNAVIDYKKGKTTALEFLMGQIQRLAKGKTDPKIAREILIKNLK